MAEDKFENTEQATPRKLEEARGKGEVAKSKEIPSAATILAAIGIFYFFGPATFGNLSLLVRSYFVNIATMEVTTASMQTLLKNSISGILLVLLPFLFIPLVGLAANILHIGFIYSVDPITPKFSKINPVSGLKKIFGLSTAVEMVKNLAKFGVVGYIAFLVFREETSKFAQLADTEMASMMSYLGSTAVRMLVKTSWVIIVIAAIDYIYQKYEWAKNLKMSKHEVKEEFKDTEGQPLVKSRIRALQRQMATQRMMQEVPEATVVVTNPTHFAVAIKYEQGKMGAPKVVAKGADHVAARIKEIAKENGVPIVENKLLARTLWKVVEIGSEVPHDLYQAIAEVLAYVFRLKQRR